MCVTQVSIVVYYRPLHVGAQHAWTVTFAKYVLNPQVEWCLPDRRIEIPEGHDILLAAKNLVKQTSKNAHLELDFSDAAREQFDSYGVMFNTRSNQKRKGADADAAAEEGTIELMHCPVYRVACRGRELASERERARERS